MLPLIEAVNASLDAIRFFGADVVKHGNFSRY